MTMWAVTQTHRFHAAVAGAGIANWQSYYGENLIDQWMIPYFGTSVYDNPAVYARSSPITYIRNVKTPTLIAVGDSDGECPAPQSFEFWHALRTLGVKTALVVYPGEGHAIRRPEHTQDLLERTITWFNQYMKWQCRRRRFRLCLAASMRHRVSNVVHRRCECRARKISRRISDRPPIPTNPPDPTET